MKPCPRSDKVRSRSSGTYMNMQFMQEKNENNRRDNHHGVMQLGEILDSVAGLTGFELPEDESSNSHQLPENGATTYRPSRQFGRYFSQMDKTPRGGSNHLTPGMSKAPRSETLAKTPWPQLTAATAVPGSPEICVERRPAALAGSAMAPPAQ